MSNNFSMLFEKYIDETDGITTVKTILGGIICASIFYKLANIHIEKRTVKHTSESHQISNTTTSDPNEQIETMWEIVNKTDIS